MGRKDVPCPCELKEKTEHVALEPGPAPQLGHFLFFIYFLFTLGVYFLVFYPYFFVEVALERFGRELQNPASGAWCSTGWAFGQPSAGGSPSDQVRRPRWCVSLGRFLEWLLGARVHPLINKGIVPLIN